MFNPMKKIKTLTLAVLLLLGFASCDKKENTSPNIETPVQQDNSIYGISIKSIDGSPDIKLSDYKGKYILIVNTASECGYTYQYKGLQEFYTKFKDDGVVVIGCPCNQFGGQEPGTDDEIEDFCQANFGVTFPLTEKIDVMGAKQHPLYQWLTQKKKNLVSDFDITWNFNKFVIGPDGSLLKYFDSPVEPASKEFLAAFNK
jgi:glutathione peroxidase